MSQKEEKELEPKRTQINQVGANIPPKIIPQQNLLNENNPQSPNQNAEKKIEKENEKLS